MPRIKRQRLKRRADGRYKCVYHGHQFYGATEEEALAAREEYKRQEAAMEFSRQNPLVRDYADAWLDRQAAGAAYQTKKEKSSLLKKLTETLGNVYVRDVRASDIKSLYADQFAGCSTSYIRSAAQAYRAIFDAAVEDGIIKTNPARQKSSRPHKGTEPETRAITDQEREWICSLCTDHRAYPAVMAMLYAGLRPQEAKALDVDRDVDIKAGRITVRETVHMKSSNQYESTKRMKTAYSGREVPIFPPLEAALKGLHGPLIQSAKGKAVTVQAWRSAWESYICCLETAINGSQEHWYGRKREHKGKQLPPFTKVTFTPYDLRHSFCTMCRDNDVEINTCIHWMGHKDAKMILKIYDEFSPDRSKREAEKLTKSLFSGSNKGSNDESQSNYSDVTTK